MRVTSSTYRDQAALRSAWSASHSAEPIPKGRLTDTFLNFAQFMGKSTVTPNVRLSFVHYKLEYFIVTV